LKKHIIITTLIFFLVTFGFSYAIADGVETSGDILQIVIPAVAFGATFIKDDIEGRNQFYKQFLASEATTYALKYLVHEKRPHGSSHDSFPSGHTSAAFQGATFIHLRYGWEYSIPAYIAATFVGYSRIETEKHYTKDVIAGAAIGILSGYIFVTPMKDVTITPIVGNGSYGLMFTKSW
jgi:membrane-associated phospholipid phosphatase